MPEIAPTLRRIERPNVGPDTSVQPFDCSLGSLSQKSLQGMEHQLDRVKVRRILRQVAQGCTNSADRLLYPDNLMEGHIIDHHNVPTLERWGQTLLYVSQECCAIHSSFDQHGSHDPGLTQASDKRHRLPVAHGRVREQPRSAGVPTVKTHHIGRDCRLVDEYEAGSVESALLANPASAPASHVSSLSLCRLQAFFKGDVVASEESRKSAAAPGDTPSMQYRNGLIQRKVRLFAVQGEDLLRILLQRRSAPPTGHWFANPIFAKPLHPANRRAGADLELFGRFTSRSPSFNKVNYTRSHLTRVRSPHCPALRRINALDSLLRSPLGIPIHSGRDAL